MAYSLSQAATAAKVRKSTIFRWVKAGKVSASRTDDGQYRIDPAELQRYLDAVATEQPRPGTAGRSAATRDTGNGADATDAEMQRAADALRAEVAKLQALLDAERQRGEEWKAQANRWAEQAERLALTSSVITPAATPALQRGGMFGWLRRA
jgi:excisionase family DNA binding protein